MWYDNSHPVIRHNTNDLSIFNEQVHYAPLGLDSSDVVLDLGAHIGAFALWANTQGVTDVTCYEAYMQNFELLKYNLLYKGSFKSIRHYSSAVVSSKMLEFEGIYPLLIIHPENTGMHSFWGKPDKYNCCPVTTADFALVLEDKFTALKVDIEGSEYYLDWTILQDRPSLKKIAIEWHFMEGKYLQDAVATHEMLLSYGFSMAKTPDFTHKDATLAIYRR